jgi:formate dehydrogenase subunit gamma
MTSLPTAASATAGPGGTANAAPGAAPAGGGAGYAASTGLAAARVPGRHAPWGEAEARAIIAGFDGVPGALLPILHALQEHFGCVPELAKPLIAHALNLSRAEVYGVVTFYHDYRAEPAGRHVLKLCRAEACQSVGGTALHRDVLSKLGLDWGGTTPDGRLTVEAVYCLGLCATAPAALLDGAPIGRLDAARLDGVIAGAMAT